MQADGRGEPEAARSIRECCNHGEPRARRREGGGLELQSVGDCTPGNLLVTVMYSGWQRTGPRRSSSATAPTAANRGREGVEEGGNALLLVGVWGTV